MSRRWKALDRIVRESGSPFELTSPTFAELATRVHEAVSAKDPSELRDLTAQLEEVIGAGLAKAPPAARAAANGVAGAGTPESCAHALGQLGFAYRVLANAMTRRAERGFEDKLRSAALAPYVDALSRADMTGSELAEALGRRPETVSRSLKELRAIGAVDFRRDGTSFVNFLTPAARLLAKAADDGRERRPIAEPVKLWAGVKTHEQEPIMRDVQSFSRLRDPV